MELQQALDAIRQKRSLIFSRYLPDPTNGYRPRDIKNVLVVISASRSGSSLLYHLLAGHPSILAPQGEEITFYKLAGLGLVDVLGASHAISNDISERFVDREALALDILRDAGRPLSRHEDGFAVERYLVDSIQRLILQWPEIDFDCDDLYQSARTAIERHLHKVGPFDANLFWLDMLSALIVQGHPINPYFYDLPHELIRQRYPSMPIIGGPPCTALCLEEAPFIVPKPKVFPRYLNQMNCLMLKSSSNCYRIEFMKSLYPNARFSFIYLTRNPAAAINGLMDGWLSNGFYSESVTGLSVLNIPGYTSAQKPWSQHWWNFDSPPGWENYTNKPLEQVCAFQWWSANKHVIDAIGSGVIDRHIVIKYENLLGLESMKNELAKALDFADLSQTAILNAFKAPAPVMAVNPPAARKWMRRAAVILPMIRSADISRVARRLGYDVSAAEHFV